jgi:hypothetical protein
MDQNPLVKELIDAGERFLERFEKPYPVAAAFWLKNRAKSRWYLYVLSAHIRDENIRDAYSEVLRITKEMTDHYFDPFQIKLLKMDNTIVEFAQDMQRRYPGRVVADGYVPTFVGVDVEGLYFYPHGVKAAVA